MRQVKFKRHHKLTRGQLDMAPLIDCVLLLMIYFMLTSSFIMQPGLKIKLPEAKTTEQGVPQPVLVSVTQNNIIFFHDRPVTITELEFLLAAEGKKGKFALVVKGDQTASHGLVVKVLDIARLAGAEKLVVATRPEL
ncbi:MAG: biopolymer transporter ExbD [Candidatus Omnitrophota bacterium]